MTNNATATSMASRVSSCRYMLLDMDFPVGHLYLNYESPTNNHAVTEDLVHYMNETLADGNYFLLDDPNWATDFAPNGEWSLFLLRKS